ncbi:BTAD domain-containing putative transcriptional regulator [Lapillicoccus sp.]|uniref:AfsR/SARP family transcriptional regulator n=1 Tax=Lapillicoccus sp. TaxID=1909287 RepID=UPI0032655EB4
MASDDIPPVYVSLLGPVRVWRCGELVGPAGAKRRGLLAILALEPNRLVPVERLVAGLWSDNPPSSADNVVQTYVSVWRRALEPHGEPGRLARRLRRTGSAYELQLAEDESDVLRCEEYAAAGARYAAAGRFGSAAAAFADALSLWRGMPLADLGSVPFAVQATRALDLHRTALVEYWAHACLQGRVGDPAAVATAIEQILIDDQLRERAVELQMWALCRDGRPAQALQLFDRTRRALADELGADPGPDLSTMHVDVLSGSARLRPSAAALTPLSSRLQLRGDGFIGRSRELADIAALLKERRLVTLVGPGGSGKTRLAEEVAAAASGAAVTVALAGFEDAALVPSAVCAAFGLTIAAADAEATLLDRLADVEGLLVLDNLEHLAAAGALVERLIRGTRQLRILATSRHPLGVATEHRFLVRPLHLPDQGESDPARLRTAATELLIDRAHAVGATFSITDTLTTLAEIVRRLDGLPLAIEIAASWLNVLSPDQLLSRLAELHDMPGPRDDDAKRHRTLDAVVEWSLRLLTHDQQTLLFRLSVFRGSASLPAIEAVCAHDLPQPVLAGVAELVNRSLIFPVPATPTPRFRLLETVRQYLTRQYVGSDDYHAVVERHRAWFANWTVSFAAHTEGPGAAEWLDNAARDIHNLRVALDGAVGTPDELQLVANCSGLWHELGHLQEGIERFERALANASSIHPARPDATALLSWLLGSVDQDRALQLAQQALTLAERAGDPLVLAYARQVAGGRSADTTAAVASLQAAIETAESAGDCPVQYAHTAPGAVRVGATHELLQRLMFSDVQAAIALCETELRRASAERNDEALAQFTVRLRLALMGAGRVEEAAQQSGPDHRVLTVGGAFNVMIADGIERFHYGQADDAAGCFVSAWRDARDRGSLFSLVSATGWIVEVHVDTGSVPSVAEIVSETHKLCKFADARTRAPLTVHRARLARTADDRQTAQRLLDDVAWLIDGHELNWAVLVWLVESAALCAARGDTSGTAGYLDALRARSAATGIVVPPWEERRIIESVGQHDPHGLRAV